jgi:hypothetical protein
LCENCSLRAISPAVGLACLVFLISRHKLEYLIESKFWADRPAPPLGNCDRHASATKAHHEMAINHLLVQHLDGRYGDLPSRLGGAQGIGLEPMGVIWLWNPKATRCCL